MTVFASYLGRIARANGLAPDHDRSGRVQWVFYPGMLQDSPEMWWADFGRRHASHEGIDICFYRRKNKTCPLRPGARIPAIADGTLINLAEDLLGTTLVVSYPSGGCRETRAVMVYSHTVPEPGLCIGDKIGKDRIIARTYDTRIRRSRLLSHLHLSCIILPRELPDSALNWSLFPDRNRVAHVNPVFL